MEDFSRLLCPSDNLINLKVEHKSAEERLQYFLETGNMEMAQVALNTSKSLFMEIRKTEREIEQLESVCFAS